MTARQQISLQQGDVLIVVDVQNDFLPGGSLAVPQGDEVVPVLNRYIQLFQKHRLPIFATRDWHPQNHCSFKSQGGIWPPHCVANTNGARFAPMLKLPDDTPIISKAETVEKDAYSGFEGTDLAERLRTCGVTRVFVGGLATDYCVLNTVKDALTEAFSVMLLGDAIRAVDVQPGDGKQAIEEMEEHGAQSIEFDLTSTALKKT